MWRLGNQMFQQHGDSQGGLEIKEELADNGETWAKV